MPTDRELLEAQVRPATVAVALAVRVLEAEGVRPTVAKVMDLTGYGRSAVYDARAELRHHWPDQYPHQHGSGTAESAQVDGPPDRTPARRLDPAALILPGTAVEPAPRQGLTPWREALASCALPLNGSRSWDAYDIYAVAWDALPDMIPPEADPTNAVLVGNQIALTADYVERMTQEHVDRAKVGLLVRQFGKAALYGLSKALGVTEHDTDQDRYRYARAVAGRVVEDLRSAE